MFGLIKKAKRAIEVFLPTRKSIGSAGANSFIEFPVYMSWPKAVFMEADTRIRQGCKFLLSSEESITIKKYTVIGMDCTIITNNHRSTVGIPQILLGISGINDKKNNLVINEDVWIGSNVTIVGIKSIGRGAIAGACSTVTHDIPPYALVVGSPAKIVGVKFTIDQIIEHEKILYPEEERFSREYLEELFNKYYVDKKVYGVSTKFSKANIERLEQCVKARKFSDPNIIERLKKLQ